MTFCKGILCDVLPTQEGNESQQPVWLCSIVCENILYTKRIVFSRSSSNNVIIIIVLMWLSLGVNVGLAI